MHSRDFLPVATENDVIFTIELDKKRERRFL